MKIDTNCRFDMRKKVTSQNTLSFYEQYRLNNFTNNRTITDSFIDELCDKLLEFASSSDGSKGFIRFLYSLGISYDSFKHWLVRYPQLQEVYQQAKLLVGEALQENALKRSYDVGLSRFILYNLDPQYLEIQKTLTSLKDKDTTNKTMIVVMDTYANEDYERAKAENPMLTLTQWQNNNTVKTNSKE